MQCECGQVLTTPAPRFCPMCGRATATLPQTDPRSAKKVYIYAGLMLAGTVFGGIAGLMGLLSLVAAVLLILEEARPAWYANFKLPAWLHRPRLGTISAILFVLGATANLGFNVGILLFLPGLWLFLRDAANRQELGPFDPRLLTYGWRILLVVGVILASFTFSAPWNPDYYYTGYSTTERHWDGLYSVWHPGSHAGGDNDAYAMGAATVPAVLMLGAMLWAAWRGKGAVPGWFRFVPAALGVLMVLSIVKYFGQDSWARGYSGTVVSSDAAGPYWFVMMLVPFFVGSAMLAMGWNGWKRGA